MSGAVAITGAARGIGLATAQRLAGDGWSVAIGDLDGELAASRAAEIGGRTIGVPLDVTDPDSVARFVTAAEERLGPLEVTVANAGVMFVGPFLSERPEATRTQFAVNVLGVAHTAQAVLPAMRARGRGQLVVVASAASWLAPPGEASYAATKHAVRGLTRGLRAELSGTGVTVSLVCPGVVDTELAHGTSPGRGKLLEPRDVAAAIAGTIDRPRDEVFVPRELGIACRIWSALPPRAAGRLSRLLGIDQVAANADPAARAAYEARIQTTQREPTGAPHDDDHR